ncbi:hypothetical protein E1B28_011240 [Marasmius oreades]|uniref:Membrane insertase YidC/Oxa/ALB C-terminal domain-containing protein n=1 Tax=Marasmius oreades TaxID=181124 RepID=A0A9P7UQ05_9AGAR|nr:uncharacterized protein E1B28_011240 [Marasmius oreades]KAG7089570.1 hypothetical protein E1B28_011240 [Marasmius oreades]
MRPVVRILRPSARHVRLSCNPSWNRSSNIGLRESLIPTRPLARSFSLNPWASKSPQTTSSVPSIPTLDESTSAATTPEVSSSEVPNTGLPAGVDTNPLIDLLPQSTLDSAISTAITTTSNSTSALQPVADLAALGLITWTPAGFFRWTLELCQHTTGIPWGHAIILTSVIWRIALFPVGVYSAKYASKMGPISPKLQELSAQMKEAYMKKDVVASTSLANQQKQLFKSAGIHPLGGIIGPLIQLPAAMGMFFGVRKMCLYPVEQLKDSGLSWIPDLTVADPTGIMPAVFGISMFWQLTVTGQEMSLTGRPQAVHILNLLRFPGTPIIAYLMTDLPSGLLLSILTTALITTVQTHLLRIPAVRKSFGMITPPVQLGPDGKPLRSGLPSFKSTWVWATDSLRDRWGEAAKQAAEKERTRREALDRKRGVGSGGIRRK